MTLTKKQESKTELRHLWWKLREPSHTLLRAWGELEEALWDELGEQIYMEMTYEKF
jgi:hypothetical protein